MNLSDCAVRTDWREVDLKNVLIAWWWSMSTQLWKHQKKNKSRYTSLMVWGSLTILCRRPPPAPPRPPPGPRWWLKTTWTWTGWGGPESTRRTDSLNSVQYKLSPVGLLIDLNHTCSCFTWASLVEPFFSFCFLSSSYFFRPSRYSATASLDGFLSSAGTRKTSPLITNYSWSQ